jgi:hypothetical protein
MYILGINISAASQNINRQEVYHEMPFYLESGGYYGNLLHLCLTWTDIGRDERL